MTLELSSSSSPLCFLAEAALGRGSHLSTNSSVCKKLPVKLKAKEKTVEAVVSPRLQASNEAAATNRK